MSTPEAARRPVAASLYEWVEHGHLKAFKIPDISGDDGNLVHERTGRDHGIFIDRVRLTVHLFRP